MFVRYNGVTLSICHFNDFRQTAVLTPDNAEYLYTHYLIDVTCVWNPYATASLAGAVQRGTSPNTGPGGDIPAVSMRNLRATLMASQKTLDVVIDSQSLLHSPQGGTNNLTGLAYTFPADANNGPHPLACSVTAFHGARTAIVRFRIETWLTEAPAKSALLTNRWSMTEEIGEDFHSTIHTSGVAVFRRDMILQFLADNANVAANSKTADSFRNVVILPQPTGFQRTNVRVQISPDGTRMDYSFTDVQQRYQLLPASGLVRCEGHSSYSYDWLGRGGIFGPLTSLPEGQFTFQAEVWGRISTPRDVMAQRVIEVLAAQIGGGGANVNDILDSRPVTAGRITVDYPRRHATASITVAMNGLVGKINNLVNGETLAGASKLSIFEDFDVLSNGAGIINGADAGRTTNVGPIDGCYSELKMRLVEQILRNPNGAFPSSNPGPATQL